jgi:PAS domain-containing protein
MPERRHQGLTHSARYAAALLIAVVAAWGLAAAGIVKAVHHVEDILVSTAGEGLARSAASVSESLNRLLFEYALQTRTFAQNPLFQSPQSETAADYFRMLKLTLPDYLDLRVTDAGGSIVGATDTSVIGKSERERAWFRVFEQGKVSSEVGPLFDADEQRFVFAAARVGSEGEVSGAVVLRVSLPSVQYVLDGIRRTSQQLGPAAGPVEYQLVGQDGLVVYDSVRGAAGERAPAAVTMATKPGFSEAVHPKRRVPVIAGFAPANGYGASASWHGTVVIRLDRAAVLASWHRYLAPMIALGAALITVLALALIWIVMRLRSSLLAMEAAATEKAPRRDEAASTPVPEGLPPQPSGDRPPALPAAGIPDRPPAAAIAQHAQAIAALDPAHWEGLRRWVKLAEVNRVCLFTNHHGEDGARWASRRYEWIGLGEVAKTEWSQWFSWCLRAKGFSRWEEMLRRGERISGSVAEFPPAEASALASCGIRTVLVVPLIIDHDWWGFIEFDHCLSERRWTDAEIDGLAAEAERFQHVIMHSPTEETVEGVLAVMDAVLESTADGLLVVDADGNLAGFNQRLVTMWRIPDAVTGARALDEITAWMMRQLKAPEVLLRTVSELDTQPDVESYDLLELEDGRTIERFSTPRRDGGRLSGRTWTFREIALAGARRHEAMEHDRQGPRA